MTGKILKNTSPADRLAILLQSLSYNDAGQLARLAKVTARQAANAQIGRPVATSGFLRLCVATGIDPLPSIQKPEEWFIGPPRYTDFDFDRLAVALKIKRGLLGHSERDAAKAMDVAPATVSRVENVHKMSIGVVLKTCQYCGIHPFGLLNPPKKAVVSRETSETGVKAVL